MDEKKIRKDLEQMTGSFCATFHKCADKVLAEPSQIPAKYAGKESEFIGHLCIKDVVKKASGK